MNYYLYRVTNKVNGKIYVGVHKTKCLDDGYMGSGKVIIRAIEKHGIENFEKEILEHFEDAASMFEREKEVVDAEFLARDDVYNLRRGGYGGFDHINNQTESRVLKNKRAREITNKILIEKYGSTCPPKARISNSLRLKEIHATKNFKYDNFKGKNHSQVSREKISSANKGKMVKEKNSQFGTFWISNGIDNKKCRGEIPDGWSRGRKTRI